jgi:hypothetical protein
MSQTVAKARYGRFEEFWPFYLSEHSKPATRGLHFIGSSLGLASLLAALFFGRAWLILLGLFLGYAFAWTGHFFVERNRPATFKYPLRSFAADFKMWGYMLTGRLGAELERWNIQAGKKKNASGVAF